MTTGQSRSGLRNPMTENNLLDAALDYASRGIPVFALHNPISGDSGLTCSCANPKCDSKGKHPRTEHGFKDATVDAEIIKQWWAKWPHANIGVPTGAASGFDVIDVDNEPAQQKLKELIPDTSQAALQKTGRGWQVAFAHVECGLTIASALGRIDGLDFRGNNGYIVAAPSRHINGKYYEWVRDLADDLPPLPDRFIECASAPIDQETGLKERFDSSVVWEGVPDGKRDETLFKYACQLRALNAPEDVARKLVAEAAARCKPPFENAQAKVDQAWKYPAGKDGAEDKPSRMPMYVCVNDVVRENVRWLWMHRTPLGKMTIIVGDPGVGKSQLTLAIAAPVTRGLPIHGDPVGREPATVLILSAEDGLADTIRPRLEDLGADLSKVIALTGMQDEQGRERAINLTDVDILDAAIQQHKPALVIIDPLIAYVGKADTHKAGEVRGILAPLAALAERHGCAVVAVQHLNKGNSKAVYRGQGSIDFLAACRSMLLVGKNPDDPTEKIICHLKSNLGPEMPSLSFSIEGGRFLWGDVSTVTAADILAAPANGEEKSQGEAAGDFLLDALKDGWTPSDKIIKSARGAGIAERTLWRAKTKLGVVAKKLAFDGPWGWELPAQACQDIAKPATPASVTDMALLGEVWQPSTKNEDPDGFGKAR